MSLRNEARLRTRESILDAAVALFADAYYDEVTLADVAQHARVSQQTVVNHFGGKAELYLTGVQERWAPLINEARQRAKPGDVTSIVRIACDDYEVTGDGTIRGLALAGRFDELAQVMAGGRASHRAWVEQCFAPLLPTSPGERNRLVTLLAVCLDVRTWFQLRRESGLSQRATRTHMEALVRAVLPHG